MLSIQDNVTNTKNHRKYILREQMSNDLCRRCNECTETVEHILSGCSVLAHTKYLERHNRVATIVYLELLKLYNLKPVNENPYYKYVPVPVVENDIAKIYWDKDIITDKRMEHNRPDITVILKQEKKAFLIDISVPNNHNLKQKYTEKLTKYAELRREVKAMWRMESVFIVPVILSTMGLIPKTLKENLKIISIPYNTYHKMQKSVVLGATNIVRHFLD